MCLGCDKKTKMLKQDWFCTDCRMEMLLSGWKFCPGCHNLKPIRAYSRHSARVDGLQPKCKSCFARYYANNRTKILRAVHNYEQDAKLNNERYNGRLREKSAKRRDRYIAAVESTDIPRGVDPKELCWFFFGKICLSTNCFALGTTLDHIKPISLGGKHQLANIQTLCKPCNSSKGARHFTDYRKFVLNTERLMVYMTFKGTNGILF